MVVEEVHFEEVLVDDGMDNSPLQASPTHLGNTATSSKSVMESLESEVSKSRDFLHSYHHLYQQSVGQEEEQGQGEDGEDKKLKTDEIGQQRLLELQRELDALENSYSQEYCTELSSNSGLETSDDIVLIETGTWGQQEEQEDEEDNEGSGPNNDDEGQDEQGKKEDDEEELDLVFIRDGVYQDPVTGKFYCLRDE